MPDEEEFHLVIELEPTEVSDASETAMFLRQLQLKLEGEDFEAQTLANQKQAPEGAKGPDVSLVEGLLIAVSSGAAEFVISLCYDFVRARIKQTHLRVTGPGGEAIAFPRDSIETGRRVAASWKSPRGSSSPNRPR